MSGAPEKTENIKSCDDEYQVDSFQCLTPVSTQKLKKQIEGDTKGQSSTSTVLQDQNPQSQKKEKIMMDKTKLTLL